MQIIMVTNKIAALYVKVTLFIIFLHIAGQVSRFVFGHDYLLGLIPLTNMEMEANFPTAWSCFLLLSSAMLSLITAKLSDGDTGRKRYWYGLFYIFIFLSLDEFIGLHERLMVITRETLHTSGLLYYAWVIPMGLFCLIVVIIYARFVLGLSTRTRNLIIGAGILFVSGAVGLELFEGIINEQGGYLNLSYMVLVTIEETLEMSGVILFNVALLGYLKQNFQPFEVSFT